MRSSVSIIDPQDVRDCPPLEKWGVFLSIRCILGDIRLWVGDPSSRRVERLFDIFLSCVPPPEICSVTSKIAQFYKYAVNLVAEDSEKIGACLDRGSSRNESCLKVNVSKFRACGELQMMG